MERMTGYPLIFRDHNPQDEVIAINAIDFEGAIVAERTWGNDKTNVANQYSVTNPCNNYYQVTRLINEIQFETKQE